jgi:phosphoribosylformylglycinamidine synthase
MDEVRRFVDEGRPVIGACNGFQILCEAGILPGALLLNEKEKFLCQDVFLRAENRESIWTRGCDQVIRLPIAHGEGRYVVEDETLRKLNDEGRVAFRYVSPNGETDPDWNVNGSQDSIAGVLNRRGNVLGLMPHPERASRALLGNTDGLMVLRALTLVFSNL